MPKINIKKWVIGLLVIMVVCFAIGFSLLGSSGSQFTNSINNISFNNVGFGTNFNYHQEIDEKKTAALDGVGEIWVTTQSTDIKVIPTDESKLTARLYGSISSNHKNYRPVMMSGIQGTLLKIETKWPRILGSSSVRDNIKMYIYLPKKYAKSLRFTSASGNISCETLKGLQIIAFSTASGDITVNSVALQTAELETASGNLRISGSFIDLNCHTASGDIDITSVRSQKANLQTSSGKILCNGQTGAVELRINSGNNDGSFSDLDCRTASGDIIITSVNSQKTNLQTSSGNIFYKGLSSSGDGEFRSNSGNINLEYGSLANDITARCDSGNIDLTLPQNAKFSFDFSSQLGEITLSKVFTYTQSGFHSEREQEKHLEGTVGTGKNRISLETISGNIRVTD